LRLVNHLNAARAYVTGLSSFYDVGTELLIPGVALAGRSKSVQPAILHPRERAPLSD
jgi:hypothetical protein